MGPESLSSADSCVLVDRLLAGLGEPFILLPTRAGSLRCITSRAALPPAPAPGKHSACCAASSG
jgi:hypothetical protein